MATFSTCPHDPTAVGIQKECPCKRMPMFFSVFTAAQYGDMDGVKRCFDRGKAGLDLADDYGYCFTVLGWYGVPM